MKLGPVSQYCLVALSCASTGCSSNEFAAFQDNQSNRRIINLSAIRCSLVAVEDYGILAYGKEFFTLPTTLAAAAASAKAATLASSRAANAAAGRKPDSDERQGNATVRLVGGFEVFSRVTKNSVEVVWFFPKSRS